MSRPQDPLEPFYRQFQSFVQNNPNVISAARAAAQIPESAKAIIVVSPYSLQHVFPRHWVSKSYRKTIVERPERLLACSMGIAAAITMYPALYTLKSSNKRRTSLNAPHVVKVHGTRWPRQVIKLCREADALLERGEVEVPSNWNAGDIYLSSSTLEALEGSIGALETGIDSIFTGPSPEHISNRAFVAIRPPGHHCHVATPAGFCVLNNAHIAVEYAANVYGVTHAAILDFDLHHGDGTQDIVWKRAGFKPEESIDENPESLERNVSGSPRDDETYDGFGKKPAQFPKVGYFSMHDINSFPTEFGYATKENIRNASTCIMNSHDLNIWNIHLSEWSTEEDFYKIYKSKYRTLFAKADDYFKTARMEMNRLGKPFKGLVVISAGFDASEYEQVTMQRHGVNVPTSFYTVFTKDALKLAQLHCQGKVLSLMEGGYADKAICSGVFAHLIGLQNQDWINEWGSEQVVKEISRGCKPSWKPYKSKKTRDVIRIWAEEVIMLGRSMIPEFDDVIFKEARKDMLGHHNLTNPSSTIAHRLRRTSRSPEKEEVPISSLDPHVMKKDREHKITAPQAPSENVPFLQQVLSSDEEDEDYVYDEELNKTFNRTVEDITIDDISRHLETLEIIEDEESDQTKLQSGHRKLQSNGMYRKPSNTAPKHTRSSRQNRTPHYDDSDISMISYTSTTNPTSKRTTRSGTRW